MSYAELICQSNFSFLQGASHPEELVKKACDYGYRALALTDECSVAGVVRAHSFIEEHRLNISLIIGAKFTMTYEGFSATFVLLCPNRKAYAELCRVITNSRRRCNKGDYQLSAWDINSLKHCLILLLPSGDSEGDKVWCLWLKKYHKQRLWLVLSRQLSAGEHHHIDYCYSASKKYKLPLLASGNVLMHDSERLPMQHVISAIKAGKTVATLGKLALVNAERSLRPLSKFVKLFEADLLAETLVVAQCCQFSLSSLSYEYPAELIPKKLSPSVYLRKLVEQGKKCRFPDGVPEDIDAIIEKELSLIKTMAYEHFFITVYDIVQFAQRRKILYQGRGSAANSVVCYCLEITSVDPRQISVLFERFISQERQQPPDIDVDFEHHRREEVFQYIYQKYGREHTAITATVITYRLKSAIREVGKVLGLNETQLEFFIKNINRRDRASEWHSQVVELGLDPQSQQGQQFVKLVDEIRGFPRHLSQHVGGFIISSGPLYELVPIENAAMEDRTVIQWDKDDLESLKLLKVDVLALGMLTAIRKSFDLIQLHYQQAFTIAQITRLGDDPNVYRMIQQADTVGIFQIESRAQMSMLPRLKPSTYYDLVVQIAIVRPGPIQGGMVHPYLKRRSGEELVDYPSEDVKEVLERTLGVPIFQEQVIKIAMVAAGFTGGEADQLRRAMGKWKKTGELLGFKDKLISGMLERGYSHAFSLRIFDQICGFGEYGFPESHSASFAVLAYVSAWLKVYYPEVFYCALLNSLPMGFYSASQLLQDAQRHQISILPVCINHSHWDHHLIEADKQLSLRLGFRLVKGIKETQSERIIEARPTEGFSSLGEIKQIGLRINELQALASANCFNVIAGNRFNARWTMMNQDDEMPLFSPANGTVALYLRDIKQQEAEALQALASKANVVTDNNMNIKACHQEIPPLKIQENQSEYTFSPNVYDDLIEDYSATGVSLDKHPITLLDDAKMLGSFTRATELKNIRHKAAVTVAGVVTGRQSPGTASGVTFMTLEDDTGNVNVVVWVATARAQKQSFLSSKILKVKGIIEREKNVIHVIAGRLIDLTEHLENFDCASRDFH